MNVTQNNASTPATFPDSDHPLRWEGHMADDVGATYGHTPMAALTASSDQLLLAGTRGSFRLPRNSVTKISRGRMYPWLFSAVRIQHNVPGYPVDLQFKPLGVHPRDVRAQLRQLGYPVA
jgi:hypothetical protein